MQFSVIFHRSFLLFDHSSTVFGRFRSTSPQFSLLLGRFRARLRKEIENFERDRRTRRVALEETVEAKLRQVRSSTKDELERSVEELKAKLEPLA